MFNNPFLAIYSISYLVLAISGFFLSIFVFFNPPRDAVRQAFSRYLFAVSWWGLFSVPMINASTEFWGTFWDRICLMGLVFIPVSFIHFNFIFLEIDKKYKIFIRLNYLITFFFFASNFTPYFLPSTSPRYGLNFFTDPGPLYYFFFLYFVFISVLGVFAFYRGFRSARGNRRRQLFNLFWSSLLGYSLGGLNFNIVFKLGLPFLAIIGNFGIFFHEIVYAYTITKQRLMDISVVISRAVAEILTVLFLGAIYLGMVGLYLAYVSPLIDLPFLVWTVLYGIIVGQVHQRIRIFIQTTSDKLFLRGKYNYYREISDASAKVVEKLSLPATLRILYRVFSDVLEASNPRILLPEFFADPTKSSSRYLVYGRRNFLPQEEGEAISFDDPRVGQLISGRSPLHFPQDPERELIVPCLLENRLIAIFVLGRKLSEDPYTDEDMRLLEALASQAAVALDHTRSYEKIKMDLELAERQLERSQRLASLGTLTAGVTHEIRNPLTVIRSETERLALEARDLNYLKRYRELMLKHIDRITGIIQRMLSLAKQKPKEEKMLDLNKLLDASLQLLCVQNIMVKKEYGKIPSIRGNPEELEEVFLNLVQNACESMPGGGTLTIKTFSRDSKIIVEISDTGKGIPEDIREKIFDPFFSTRHEGVGLGLSIAYRIVRAHGGRIEIESKEGDGTTFRVVF